MGMCLGSGLSRSATVLWEIGRGYLCDARLTVLMVVGRGNPELVCRHTPGNGENNKNPMGQLTPDDPSSAGRYHYESRIAFRGNTFSRMNVLVRVCHVAGKSSWGGEPEHRPRNFTGERLITMYRGGRTDRLPYKSPTARRGETSWFARPQIDPAAIQFISPRLYLGVFR